MSAPKHTATYLLAASLFCLAGSITFFAVEISRFSGELPAILDGVEAVSGRLDPALQEMGQVRALIPDILKETAAVREQIPAVLTSMDKASDAVGRAATAVQETRPHIPEVLAEVRQTRRELPPMLDQAERIVDKAGRVTEKSVTGVVTGLSEGPRAVVGGVGALGRSLLRNLRGRGMTDADQALFNAAVDAALAAPKEGFSEDWQNRDSGREGVVTLTNIDTGGATECRSLRLEVRHKGKGEQDEAVTLCRTENGWDSR